MFVHIGDQVRLTSGSSRPAAGSLLKPGRWYTVATVEPDRSLETHWPGCPNPLNCCCLPDPQAKLIRLIERPDELHHLSLFTVRPTRS